MINPAIGDAAMMHQIRTSFLRASFHRAQGTLLQDGLGVAALVVILLVALHLPGV